MAMDQMEGCGKSHARALLAGGPSEGENEVRFADITRAEQNQPVIRQDLPRWRKLAFALPHLPHLPLPRRDRLANPETDGVEAE